MINYRVAFVGDESEAYQKAEEFFAERNAKDEEFQIELVNIEGLDELDIKSMHFHSVIYDTQKVKEPEKERALKNLLESKKHVSDLKIFPITESPVTSKEEKEEEKYLEGLSGKEEITAIPINVSNPKDLKAVFQAVEIGSMEFKAKADDILDRETKEYEMTEGLLFNAMEEKSPYTASHFRQVSVLAAEIARRMGFEENKIRKFIKLGIMHDAGKLLMTTENLESEHMTVGNERAQMALHAKLGTMILARDMFTDEEKAGIEGHHKDSESIYAKIITVADCIDTMFSQRKYNNPKEFQEVLRDLIRNTHSRSYIDKDGNKVKVQPQFDKEVANTAIVMLADVIGQTGFDARKMIQATGNEYSKKYDDEILQILNEHSNEITIDLSAKERAYTSLGFRLSETGHPEYENRPASIVNHETRIRSEYEFAIFKNSTDEQKKKAATIMDLEANFLPEKLAEFRQMAENKIEREDEQGKNAVEAGKVRHKSMPEQIKEAAQNDREYNSKGYISFITEFAKARENKQNEQQIDEQDQKGA